MSRLKDYFHFQKEEKVAFFLLLGIIVSVIIFLQVDQRTPSKSEEKDFSAFEEKIADFEAAMAEKEKPSKESAETPITEELGNKDSYTLSHFDPNGLPIENWMQMGLSKAQAEVIINYEEKGGYFYTKEDVKKMYSISKEKYLELEPYILIKKDLQRASFDKEENWTPPYWEKEEEEPLYFDLNFVDSSDLTKVRGIGPAFASRIVKFREDAGGFQRKEQLLDVWGMDGTRYENIKESFFVDSTSAALHKININTATAAEMKTHPYISWNVANSIEKYRSQNGSYTELEEIKKSHLINDSLFNKIRPYLTLK